MRPVAQAIRAVNEQRAHIIAHILASYFFLVIGEAWECIWEPFQAVGALINLRFNDVVFVPAIHSRDYTGSHMKHLVSGLAQD